MIDRRKMLLSSLAAPLAGQTGSGATPSRQYYELRWFYLRNSSHAERMMDLLKNHWAPAAKRVGIDTPGFFQPSIGDQSPSVLMLSCFSSASDAASAYDRMMRDTDFAAAYAKAQVPEPAFTRMAATLLHAFEGWPVLQQPPARENNAPLLFEMRTYESNTMLSLRTKLEMFNAGGEAKIFARLGMMPVFFGEAVFGRDLPHLTYMLSYPSLAAREQAWQRFGADPEWGQLRSRPGYSNEEIVSNISNTILSPLPFSQIR